jgi:hypothetical protein
MTLTVDELRRMLADLPEDARVTFSGWQRVQRLTVYETWSDKQGNFTLTFEEIN